MRALQSIQSKVDSLGMINPFWDVIYKGKRITPRKPKREKDVLPTIRGLLYDSATAKNFEVFPEHPIGAGMRAR